MSIGPFGPTGPVEYVREPRRQDPLLPTQYGGGAGLVQSMADGNDRVSVLARAAGLVHDPSVDAAEQRGLAVRALPVYPEGSTVEEKRALAGAGSLSAIDPVTDLPAPTLEVIGP